MSWRYKRKDIEVGDMVRPSTDWLVASGKLHPLLIATGKVTAVDTRSGMRVTVDWNMPGLDPVMDVNDVEMLGRQARF